MKKLMVFIIIAAAMMCLTGCDCEQQRVASLAMSSNQLTVHFNANGGSGTMSDITVTYEKETRLPICTFTPPTGKKFGYWNDQADGSGSTTLEDGEVYILHKLPVNEVTIYAIWINEDEVSAKYRIKFDSNGGSSSMADLTADEGQRVALPLCTFTPPVGKKFGHWNINADDSGLIKLPDGAAIDSLMSLPVTTVLLYAIWVDENTAPTIYTIHFDANGGSGTMADMTADSNGSITLPLCTLTPPTGKRFGYWNINADDSGMVKLPDGASAKSLILLPVSDIWLYAIWIDKDAHRIIYNNLNNVDNTLNPTLYKESDTIVLTDLTADGWSFNGWFDATEDGNKVSGWNAGERIEDVTLYARWTVNVYNIVYKDQGDAAFSGEHGADYPTEHTYNVVTNLVSPTKTGYDFGGWHFAADCSDENLTVLAANDLSTDITLYTKWSLHNYSITYNNMQNGSHTNTTTFTIEDDISLVNATRDGYTFSGWYDAENDGNSVTGWNVGDVTADVSLYARWTPKQYQVTLKDGDTVKGIITAVFDEVLPSQTSPSKTGYTFGGYWTEQNGKGMQYIDGEGCGCRKWDLTSDTILISFFMEHEEHQAVFINPIDNNAVMPNAVTFKETQDITINDSISADECTFLGWYDTVTGGSPVTGWNAGEKTANVTLYARWTGVNNDGNFVIENEVFPYTSLIQVMHSPVTVVGSDDNWSGYCDSGCSQMRRGVFISGRTVKLSPYRIGKYEITQKLYQVVMNYSPYYYYGEGDNLPTYKMGWNHAIAFCNKLSLLMGKTPCYSVSGITDWERISYSDIPTSSNSTWYAATCDITKNGYRMPTEAEWEFAARGGDPNAPAWKYGFAGVQSLKQIFRGSTENDSDYKGTNKDLAIDGNLATVGWYRGNVALNKDDIRPVQPVGSKLPNTLGLYDMSGNATEWCWDEYYKDVTFNDESYKKNGVVTDPCGPVHGSTGGSYICRRGSWSTYSAQLGDAYMCSVSYRDYTGIGNTCDGLRLVQSVR